MARWGRGRGRGSEWGWRPYVPVAKRQADAAKRMEKLRKDGKNIQPVHIEGRAIAASVWGKKWLTHLESYSDFANRLPRGRSYVRNGSVCHLDIQAGQIEAFVAGSDLYTVTIKLKPYDSKRWSGIKSACRGQIGSLLELLQGRISDRVMTVVADRQTGLFPDPNEIEMKCSCPDWATMCKHVAATLYGVGARLDHAPELLFKLRGVDPAELVDIDAVLSDATAADEANTAIGGQDLAALFGIELDEVAAKPAPDQKRKGAAATLAPQAPPPSKAPAKTAARKTRVTEKKTMEPFITDDRPNGDQIRRLRIASGLSVTSFANKIGASAASVSKWESTHGALNLQARKLAGLLVFQEGLLKKR